MTVLAALDAHRANADVAAAVLVAIGGCLLAWAVEVLVRRRKPPTTTGRHRDTTAPRRRWTVARDDDGPPLPTATRQQLREAER